MPESTKRWHEIELSHRSSVLAWWLARNREISAVFERTRTVVTSVVTEDPHDLGMRLRLGACTLEVGVSPSVGSSGVWIMVIETRRDERRGGHARHLLEVFFEAFRGWSVFATPIVAAEPIAHHLARLIESLATNAGCQYFAPHIDPSPLASADRMYDELAEIDHKKEHIVFDGAKLVWVDTPEFTTCARCGMSVPRCVAITDVGTGPEAGVNYSYCSDGCCIRH